MTSPTVPNRRQVGSHQPDRILTIRSTAARGRRGWRPLLMPLEITQLATMALATGRTRSYSLPGTIGEVGMTTCGPCSRLGRARMTINSAFVYQIGRAHV